MVDDFSPFWVAMGGKYTCIYTLKHFCFTHTHTRTHACARAHTHTQIVFWQCVFYHFTAIMATYIQYVPYGPLSNTLPNEMTVWAICIILVFSLSTKTVSENGNEYMVITSVTCTIHLKVLLCLPQTLLSFSEV